MSLYESVVRPLLFNLDPETAHEAGIKSLDILQKIPLAARALEAAFSFRHPSLETTVAGLRFPNPIGLAAGFDKDGTVAGILPSLGFGFAEIGTVTLNPQPGNPRPRLFRLPEEEALFNRLGFNSLGAHAVRERLKSRRKTLSPLGINIGLNKDAPAEDAPRLYAETFSLLSPFGDYFTINVSSPNTDGLRRLQERERLDRILSALQERNETRKPIFVKLAPDLDEAAFAGLVPLLERSASGVILTNTTNDPVARRQTLDDAGERRGRPIFVPFEGGGLSGRPLASRSTNAIRTVFRLSDGRLPIIGAGGVFDAEDAYAKIRAGASLVQAYTGLIYRGPSLPGTLSRGLAKLLQSHGLPGISDAVGLSLAKQAHVQSPS